MKGADEQLSIPNMHVCFEVGYKGSKVINKDSLSLHLRMCMCIAIKSTIRRAMVKYYRAFFGTFANVVYT